MDSNILQVSSRFFSHNQTLNSHNRIAGTVTHVFLFFANKERCHFIDFEILRKMTDCQLRKFINCLFTVAKLFDDVQKSFDS